MNLKSYIGFAGAFLIAIYIGLSLSEGSVGKILPIFLVLTLILGFVKYEGYLVVITIILCFIPGRSSFSSLGYYEGLGIVCITYYLIKNTTKKKLYRNKKGILALSGVILLGVPMIIHSIPYLNDDVGNGGKRLALISAVTIILCYLILNGEIDSSKFRYLPIAGVFVGLIYGGLDVILYAFPNASNIINMFYNEIGSSPNEGDSSYIIRITGLREFGFYLGLLILCNLIAKKDSDRKVPTYIISILGLTISIVAILLSGFRSYLLSIVTSILITSIFIGRKAILTSLIILIVIFTGLIEIQNRTESLPFAVQRAMSIFPAAWDRNVNEDALGGIEWRKELRSIYFENYFNSSTLLIGRGEVNEKSVDELSNYGVTNNFQFFVLRQMWHNGIISTLDYAGTIGLVGLFLCILNGFYCFIVIFKYKSHSEQWMVWSLMAFFSTIPWFLYTGFYNYSFMSIAILTSLLESARLQLNSNKI